MNEYKKEYGYLYIETEADRKLFSPKIATDEFWDREDKKWDTISYFIGDFHPDNFYRRKLEAGEGYEIIPPDAIIGPHVYFEAYLPEFGWIDAMWNEPITALKAFELSENQPVAYRRKKTVQEQIICPHGYVLASPDDFAGPSYLFLTAQNCWHPINQDACEKVSSLMKRFSDVKAVCRPVPAISIPKGYEEIKSNEPIVSGCLFWSTTARQYLAISNFWIKRDVTPASLQMSCPNVGIVIRPINQAANLQESARALIQDVVDRYPRIKSMDDFKPHLKALAVAVDYQFPVKEKTPKEKAFEDWYAKNHPSIQPVEEIFNAGWEEACKAIAPHV